MNDDVIVNGTKYRPVNEVEAKELGEYIASFTSEGSTFWRNFFIERDTGLNGERYGMYDEGDEEAPFFTEAFLYNLLGKDADPKPSPEAVADLEKKLSRFKDYFNQARVHQGLAGITPNRAAGEPPQPPASLHDYHWKSYCDGLFELRIAA